MTVYGLQKVCFNPCKSEKHFCLNNIDFNVVPCLTENQRRHAIGMLQAGFTYYIFATHVGVHRNTIQSLLMRYIQSNNTKNRQRSSHPRLTYRQQVNHIKLVHLRYRFQTSIPTARCISGLRSISSRIVRIDFS